MSDRVSTPGSPAGLTPRIFVISGPGGVGKGTIVDALMRRDPHLRLSRSWTTRSQRPGESDDAYVFTTREAFQVHRDSGGFLEWTEFLGNYYGTPVPDLSAGRDIVLEIEVDGARQVKARHPESILIFILPPSRDEQRRRLEGRGDPDHKVHERLRKAEEEEPVGLALADATLVNDDLTRTVDELVSLIDGYRGR
ncbi:MAG: guanylate kinase [Actinobacteria bacterium]|nr:guanylate kinase [Actinomycetota bacterium]